MEQGNMKFFQNFIWKMIVLKSQESLNPQYAFMLLCILLLFFIVLSIPCDPIEDTTWFVERRQRLSWYSQVIHGFKRMI